MTWIVYILRCADDTLYTGITRNLTRRLARHHAGRGARYTRGRGPLIVIYQEPQPSHGTALQRERFIKKLSRSEKLKLADLIEVQQL